MDFDAISNKNVSTFPLSGNALRASAISVKASPWIWNASGCPSQYYERIFINMLTFHTLFEREMHIRLGWEMTMNTYCFSSHTQYQGHSCICWVTLHIYDEFYFL